MRFKQWLLEAWPEQKTELEKKVECLFQSILDYWPEFLTKTKMKEYEEYLLSIGRMETYLPRSFKDMDKFTSFIDTLDTMTNLGVDLQNQTMWDIRRVNKILHTVSTLYHRYDYSKDEFRVQKTITHLAKLDEITGSRFTDLVLSCFPVDHSVDWRPNETVPEDYY